MRSLVTRPLGGLSCLVPFGWKILFSETQVIYNTEGYLGLEELNVTGFEYLASVFMRLAGTIGLFFLLGRLVSRGRRKG